MHGNTKLKKILTSIMTTEVINEGSFFLNYTNKQTNTDFLKAQETPQPLHFSLANYLTYCCRLSLAFSSLGRKYYA